MILELLVAAAVVQPDEQWITLAAASIENASEAAEASASGVIELHPENKGLCRLTSNQQ